MKEIKNTFLLNNNFYSHEYEKKQIVIGNTFNSGMNHVNGWKNRLNGHYKKISTFTIDENGKIYQHFDPKYFSEFLPQLPFNKHIISISVSNRGWFNYDVSEKKYIDWCGNIYNGEDVVEKRWRNHSFWEKYDNKQLFATIKLVRYLIEKYNIKGNVMGHNTLVKNIELFEGVSYRSNWIKDGTDLNPTWEFDIFKEEIEKITEKELK